MEALTSSLSTNILTRNINKTVSPSSMITLLGRSDFGFSRSPTFRGLDFHNSGGTIAKSHVAHDAAEVLMSMENAIAGFPNIKSSKTMHVKFQLQKKCMFGEQFMLVGDDQVLGFWNPANAIPMNWSDGHIWNVKLDIPMDSTIQFKFILKQRTGEMIWQPGPDRIFKSWESGTSIIVSEDWKNPEAQKIMEERVYELVNPDLINTVEGYVINQSGELLPNINNDITFSGNVAYPEEKLSVDAEFLKEGPPKENNSGTLTGNNGEGNVLVPGTAPLLADELGSTIADSPVWSC
ncbi:uncharacterized protein LOC126686408 [Mercurialis annua]|uniref:uncharacterized protein LOC126686408 n=1 Tax=Mercurialis annua TaxID=3986 RepID=UPI0021603FFA|nr:uncharacterized protein LOC126686408 [Mercurialis annua]